MTDQLLYMREKDILARSFADEVLLAAPRRSEIDQLKGPAADVWDLLDRPRTLADIVEELKKRYGGAPVERVQDDVQALLDDLVARGWIRAVTDADD
jgi:sulfur transfer complex TusBCD TusB component (DsrH family)